MEIIDALGQQCPLPVVRAKKALDKMDTGTVQVIVDNETSVNNLTKLAQSLGCRSTHEQRGEKEYAVTIEKDVDAAKEAEVAAEEGVVFVPDVPKQSNAVVVIGSECMGMGNDELGKNLMKAFIFSLSQLDELPKTILFYNGGVRWTTEGSEALGDLQALADAGVEILSCGTCLKFYDLEDKVAVGEVTNMYFIVEKQSQASVVIRP